MRVIITALSALVILSACSRNDVSIRGRLIVADSDKIYLDKVLLSSTVTVDSAKMDGKGRFRFKIKNSDPTPTIYFLRSGNSFAALLLSAGEKVSVEAIGSFSENYSIKGSPESMRMLELREIMTSGMSKLDSIANAFSAADTKDKNTISASYAEQYYATKRKQIDFIVSKPGSIASLYALYQRLPNDQSLADGKSDILYYRLVADSAGAKYPGSPYVKGLNETIQNYEKRADIVEMLNKSLAAEPLNYPEIEMPDIYGNRHKLSDLHGKVIVLDFWTTQSQTGPINNAEMKKLYSEFADKGLEIYQVCLDITKISWVSAVTAQKIPWISVSDLKGAGSPNVSGYNLNTVPTNFVIDREGNIVAIGIYGAELEECVKKLI